MDLYATNSSLIRAVQSRMAKRRNEINNNHSLLNISENVGVRKAISQLLRNGHKSQMLDKRLLKILYKLDYFSIVL